jgi:hypothetical protein
VTRKQRHRRLSHLFTIDAHIPKLDVAGSTPVSRSNFSKNLADSIFKHFTLFTLENLDLQFLLQRFFERR